TKFDVPATTPLKSINFYNQVFGWTFQPCQNQTKWTASVESTEHQIFGNPFLRKAKSAQSLTNAIEVENVDQTLRNIQAAGGKVIVPKFEIPSIGWMAYFKDLEDNIFGIMQTHQPRIEVKHRKIAA
ncbi:MAG: VOC family protein, partial [Bacteroidota bacterium]